MRLGGGGGGPTTYSGAICIANLKGGGGGGGGGPGSAPVSTLKFIIICSILILGKMLGKMRKEN